MAHFYVTASGQSAGHVSRAGSKGSGIDAHVRGWDIGVHVIGKHVDGRDVFHVYRTGGSNGGVSSGVLIAIVDADKVTAVHGEMASV